MKKRKAKKKPIIILSIIIVLIGLTLFLVLNNTKNTNKTQNKELKVSENTDNSLTAKLKKEKYVNEEMYLEAYYGGER